MKWTATQIRNQVPAAIPVHCLAHCLNLCLQGAGRKLTFLSDALDTVRKIAQLIKFSPKRAHLFSEKLANQKEAVAVTIKVLCATRWTARTGAIGAVIIDYEILMDTLEKYIRLHTMSMDLKLLVYWLPWKNSLHCLG